MILKTKAVDKVTLAELLDARRPDDLLRIKEDGEDGGSGGPEAANGTWRWRTPLEADLSRVQKEAIRMFLDDDRFDAVAHLTEALTGIRPERPEPSRQEEYLGLFIPPIPPYTYEMYTPMP